MGQPPPVGQTAIGPDGQYTEVWNQYFVDQANTATGAPADARYFVGTADADLTNQTNLGSLASGFLKITVAAGIATPSSVATIPTSSISGTLTVPFGGSGATTLTGILKGNGVGAFTAVTAPAGVIVGDTDTQTLTNKRVTPRVTTITSSATPTVNTDNCDAVTITALATAITSMTTNLSGTPTNFQKLIVRILDNGTARGITWGASFVAKGTTLPTTTVISKLLTVGFIYDTVAATWGCVAAAQEA